MKSLRLFLPCIALASLWGCGPKDSSKAEPAPNSTPTAAATAKLQVALLTPGPVSDAGWSAMAYEGLKVIEKDMGAEVMQQEAQGPKIRDAMRAYAQKKVNIVFGHGFEYNEPAMQVAKDFPDTVFISSSGSKTAANVGAFRFYLEQGFYLAGYMAGSMTKTGKVAMIGGPDVPSIRSTFKGFAAGVKAAKPDAVVIEKFTGKNEDIAAAKQATLAAIAEGADFVVHQANAGAQGVFDACKEKGVYAFGANLDQNSASDAIIASAIIKAAPAFLALAKEVQNKTFKGSIHLVGMDQDAIDFVINPKLKDKVPADLQTKLDQLKADIKSGKLTVPKDEF